MHSQLETSLLKVLAEAEAGVAGVAVMEGFSDTTSK